MRWVCLTVLLSSYKLSATEMGDRATVYAWRGSPVEKLPRGLGKVAPADSSLTTTMLPFTWGLPRTILMVYVEDVEGTGGEVADAERMLEAKRRMELVVFMLLRRVYDGL
jgi:hypothetical protein